MRLTLHQIWHAIFLGTVTCNETNASNPSPNDDLFNICEPAHHIYDKGEQRSD